MKYVLAPADVVIVEMPDPKKTPAHKPIKGTVTFAHLSEDGTIHSYEVKGFVKRKPPSRDVMDHMPAVVEE